MTFDRIVCGVDGSPESAEAIRQADLLLARLGTLTLVAVEHAATAVVPAGFGAVAVAGPPSDGLRQALLEAEDSVAYGTSAHPRLVRGAPAGSLVNAIREDDATLVALGSHGTGRLAGIALGSVATTLVHSAPCSVLVARGDGTWFPRSIVVGHDGSPEAVAAADVAAGLARRFGSHVRTLAATDGRPLDVDGLTSAGLVEFVDRTPVDALVEASRDADLVVVGSRGLRGVRALASVSERVAHQAACSVLVVREGSGE